MALPQKAIDELQREPVFTPGWSGRLLMFSSTLFFTTLVIYFGLTFGYIPYVEDRVSELKQKVEEFNTKIPPAEQESLINFYSQVVNLKTLLNERVLATVALPWLERNTHKDVFFASLGVNVLNGTMNVSGRARSVQALAEQLKFFQEHSDIEEFSWSGTAVDEEGFWGVSLGLTMREDFFTTLALPAAPSDFTPAPDDGTIPALLEDGEGSRENPFEDTEGSDDVFL